MPTHGIIAYGIPTNWRGVYVHLDARPAMIGDRVLKMARSNEIKVMEEWHPGGFHYLGKICYCHDASMIEARGGSAHPGVHPFNPKLKMVLTHNTAKPQEHAWLYVHERGESNYLHVLHGEEVDGVWEYVPYASVSSYASGVNWLAVERGQYKHKSEPDVAAHTMMGTLEGIVPGDALTSEELKKAIGYMYEKHVHDSLLPPKEPKAKPKKSITDIKTKPWVGGTFYHDDSTESKPLETGYDAVPSVNARVAPKDDGYKNLYLSGSSTGTFSTWYTGSSKYKFDWVPTYDYALDNVDGLQDKIGEPKPLKTFKLGVPFDIGKYEAIIVDNNALNEGDLAFLNEEDSTPGDASSDES